MQTDKRAVLFVNGQAKPGFEVSLLPGDFLVAVDGGLRHLKRLELKPDMLIGDLDSVDADELAEIEEVGVEVLRFPPAKDQTDLELALVAALTRGYREIVIAFGLGGRLDHSLGNLALLSRPDLKEVSLRFDDGETEVFLAGASFRAVCQPGDIVSLLPWNGAARDITTTGLEYPLKGETLLPWQTRGVSNLCTGEEFSVSHGQGGLLVIHQRQEDVIQENKT